MIHPFLGELSHDWAPATSDSILAISDTLPGHFVRDGLKRCLYLSSE